MARSEDLAQVRAASLGLNKVQGSGFLGFIFLLKVCLKRFIPTPVLYSSTRCDVTMISLLTFYLHTLYLHVFMPSLPLETER